MDCHSYAPHTGAALRRPAKQWPKTLACTRGSAWQSDGAALLRHLAEALGAA